MGGLEAVEQPRRGPAADRGAAGCSWTGAPRPKRHILAEGEELEVRPAPPAPSVLVPEDMPLVGALRGRAPAGGGQARRDGHPSRAPATASGTLVHGLLGHAVAGGDDPARPGIVHRLDRDTSGPAGGRPVASARTGACSGCCATARWTAATWRSCTGRAPPALTIDRPVGRDRRNRTRMAVDRGRRAARGDPPAPPGGPGPLLAARGPPRDRAHPPDPRPPGVGRPPGGGRPRLRPPRGDARPGAPVPPRRPAGLPPSRDGRADRRREPAPARTSRPPSTGPGAAGAPAARRRAHAKMPFRTIT